MSQLPQGGETISAELDKDVAATLKGRFYGRAIRFGSLAVSAAAGYAADRMHLNTAEWIGAMLPGLALNIGVGAKLAIERTAAIVRNEQREQLDGKYFGTMRTEGDMGGFFRAATFGGAAVANTLATMGGALCASYAAGNPRDALVLGTCYAAYFGSATSQTLSELTLRHTGQTFVETPPEMHERLFGTGTHFSFDTQNEPGL